MSRLSRGQEVDERGFATVLGVLSLAEMQQLTDDLDRSGVTRSRAGLRHALRLASVAQLARDPRLLDLAKEILDGEALPFRATLFDKSAESNWLVVWHQDTALPLRERKETAGWGPWSVKDGIIYAHAPADALSRVLALRVHLDESTPQNGPLRVLPGTHKRGVLTDDEIQGLSQSIAPSDCLVPQGGVLAMRPLLVHASSKSQSYLPRRVLHIEYAVSMNLTPSLELATA